MKLVDLIESKDAPLIMDLINDLRSNTFHTYYTVFDEQEKIHRFFNITSARWEQSDDGHKKLVLSINSSSWGPKQISVKNPDDLTVTKVVTKRVRAQWWKKGEVLQLIHRVGMPLPKSMSMVDLNEAKNADIPLIYQLLWQALEDDKHVMLARRSVDDNGFVFRPVREVSLVKRMLGYDMRVTWIHRYGNAQPHLVSDILVDIEDDWTVSPVVGQDTGWDYLVLHHVTANPDEFDL